MKVTGFSFIRNAIKYDYPVKESILSILPIVDEYVIAVGKSDDDTRALIASIDSDKIKILDTVWDDSLKGGGIVLSVETNKAFQAISKDTDWAFYLQGDECLHEKDHDNIRQAMETWLPDKTVDGLLFKYFHFYGSFAYIGAGRKWYRKEIRIIRNNPDIVSWNDAQGFRFSDHSKLKVKEIDAHIYHYGWVKDPRLSNQKALYFHTLHFPDYVITEEEMQKEFDYHNIDRLNLFSGSHPKYMTDKIAAANWKFEFDPTKKRYNNMKFKHKLGHFVEDLTGIRLGEYKNYKKV